MLEKNTNFIIFYLAPFSSYRVCVGQIIAFDGGGEVINSLQCIRSQ